MPATPEELVFYGHPRSGNAYKVALMLALTGAPHRFELVDLNAGKQRTPEYLKISRFGQVPALVHGEIKIAQSNAILLYLAELTGKFAASGTAQKYAVLEWMMWEQDVLFTGVGRTRFLTKVVKGDPGAIAFLRKLGERGLGVLETRLGESPYLAGAAPTVADIAVYSYARLAEEAGYDLGGQPKILAWRKSIEALPGWAPPATLMPIA